MHTDEELFQPEDQTKKSDENKSGGELKCPFHTIWNPLENSHQVNKDLRATCPVAHTDQLGGVWGIFKYQDILQVTKEMASFSNATPRHPDLPRPPLEADPPAHTDIRKMLQPFFSRQRMIELEPKVRQLVIELLAPVIEGGEGDMIKDVANQLPTRTVLNFLNIPESDWSEVLQFSHDLFEASYGNKPELYENALKALNDYCFRIVKSRRENPLDPETDIMSRLLAGTVDGQPTDDKMAIGVLNLLLTAGHETTIVSIGKITSYLAQNPEAQQQLRENLELVPKAVEEILRYDSTVPRMPRTVKKDVVIGGQELKAGEKVFLMFGSANRDEEAFPDADKVILDRTPNLHMVFGAGIHKCLGAPIALLELRLVFAELLSRTKSFEINGGIERTGYPHFGFRSLPIAVKT